MDPLSTDCSTYLTCMLTLYGYVPVRHKCPTNYIFSIMVPNSCVIKGSFPCITTTWPQ